MNISPPEDTELAVPSDPAIRKKIRDAVAEASAILQMIDDRKEQMKDIVNMAKDDLEVPKRTFNRMVKAFHKQSYVDMVQDDNTFQLFYENIMEDKV